MAFLTAALLSGVCVESRAQTGADLTARMSLLRQAEASRSAGDHARALGLVTQALQIAQSLPALRFAAEESYSLNRLADAFGYARQCVQSAGVEPASPNRDRVVAGCQDIVNNLQNAVGHLSFRIPAPAPAGLEIRVAGYAVRPALWSAESPITPGIVDVEATAPGREPFRTRVTVAAGSHQSVEVALAFAPAAPAPGEREPAGATPAVAASPSNVGTGASDRGHEAVSPSSETDRESLRHTQSLTRALGIVGLGAGALFLGISAGLEAAAGGQYGTCSTAPAGCNASTRSSIGALDATATVGVYLGTAVFLAGGALLIYSLVGVHPDRAPQVAIDPVHGTAAVRFSF